MQEKRAINMSGNASSTQKWLLETLLKLKAGDVSVEETVLALSKLPYEEMEWAKVDHHRGLRVGFPEVIFGLGKTADQIAIIAERLALHSPKVLVTHATQEAFEALKTRLGDAIYNPASRTIVVNRAGQNKLKPGITVVTGGTSDIPVAEEAAVTAELMNNQVEKIFDVGVAGIHRLLDKLPQIRSANVIIVAAGMEGALPSVIAGLVSVPVIAVPTSIGYGASFNGIAPLLTMLNSCAPGISVVNIDNGFGAGYLAGLINLGKGQ